MNKFLFYILLTFQIFAFNFSSRKTEITEVVKKVSPAVVGITVYQTQKYVDPFFSFWDDDPFFKQFFGDRSYTREIQSLGSGFIISEDGYIVTNDHVAGNGNKIIVTLTNGESYNAKIIGTDYTSDICLLKIDVDYKLPFISLGDSKDIIIGEWVVALGNPFGLFNINDQPTVSVGVVSAKNLVLDPSQQRYYTGMIQTDAAINGGNSGGPLVNINGEVIGINTIIYSAGSGGNIGIGFAVPINKVKKYIEKFKKGEKINRNFWTGLSVQNLNDNIIQTLKLKSRKGVIVDEVANNSPAYYAGINIGDIITQVNDYKISNTNQLVSVFYEFEVNDVVNVRLIRNNETIETKMKLLKKD
ncbi:MAG TPA: trypsin-like peptidase domain-containing protein [Ignavibacteriales bacterium]|nr:trypsin-like peptidase domain-containing protein [Ignavibacteriales bacterium]